MKKNLWILLGLITILLAVILLLSVLLFSAKQTKTVAKTVQQVSIPAVQTTHAKSAQSSEQRPNTSSQQAFTPPFEEETAVKIKSVFEPLLSETESEKLGRLYATKGYHSRILPDLYNDLRAQHLPAEEQDKYQKIQAAHQQAIQILQQDRALKEQPAFVAAASTPKQKEEFYLPGLDAIKGPNGQPQISRKEIICPERYTRYKTWNKICQEIQFKDGTKSIMYVVTARGITAREDFDAQGNLLMLRSFWTAGGYFDPEKIRHIPDYPSELAETFYYDKTDAVNKIEIFPIDARGADKDTQTLQNEFANKSPDIVVQSFKNAPKYCDLYPSECVTL